MTKKLLKKDFKILPFEQPAEFYRKKAIMHLDRNNYFDAVGLYRKALEKDYTNEEYSLELAELLSEMCYFEESNQVLFELVRKGNPPAECYFAMGCNFLGMQEFDSARQYFARCRDIDKNGEFADDITEIFSMFSTQEALFEVADTALKLPAMEGFSLANRGKRYLDNGEYKKAVVCLKKALSVNDRLIYAKNNLSLAYFCLGQTDSAIETAKQVLEQDPKNIHAICNLAIFCNEAQKTEELGKIKALLEGLKVTEPEEIQKAALTYCEMRMHDKANEYLLRLLPYMPYDKKTLHYLAVSYYNLGQFAQAAQYWSSIIKIDPYNSIATYYRNMALNHGKGSPKTLSYHYQVPYDEIVRRCNQIKAYASGKEPLPPEEDNAFFSLLLWGLETADVGIKRNVIALAGQWGGARARFMLRVYLMKRSETDQLKNEAIRQLRQMGEKGRLLAYLSETVTEVDVHAEIRPADITLADSVAALLTYKMKKRHETGFIAWVISVWGKFFSLAGGRREFRRSAAWAAAVEYFCCMRRGVHIFKNELCRDYGVSQAALNRRLDIIKSIMDRETERFMDD